MEAAVQIVVLGALYAGILMPKYYGRTASEWVYNLTEPRSDAAIPFLAER